MKLYVSIEACGLQSVNITMASSVRFIDAAIFKLIYLNYAHIFTITAVQVNINEYLRFKYI